MENVINTNNRFIWRKMYGNCVIFEKLDRCIVRVTELIRFRMVFIKYEYLSVLITYISNWIQKSVKRGGGIRSDLINNGLRLGE